MFYRRPRRFADYLVWECCFRALIWGAMAAAVFGICWHYEPPLERSDAMSAFVGACAAALDAFFRHPRFFRDFALIRELEGWHRRGDFTGLLHGELLVWNGAYALNFGVGFVASLVLAEALGATLEWSGVLRVGACYAAVFYWIDALWWRVRSYDRVMSFLRQLKVDYVEHMYG